MTKRVAILAGLVIAVLGFGRAGAHECTYSGDKPETGTQEECHETPVMPNWRDGNYVPLFDLEDRDDPEQRKETQRWRDCQGYDTAGRYYNNQFCIWANFGNSAFPGPGGDGPNEFHAGSGGQHCFLFEFAHQCEHHDKRRGEGVHDAHGGSAYVDVCLTENPESKYCDDGMADTGAAVIIMDHNPCGTIVPVVACTDEYHVIRPFDDGYTQHQMEDSVAYIQEIVYDPELYLCGYKQYRDGLPICPGDGPARDPASSAAALGGSSIARAAGPAGIGATAESAAETTIDGVPLAHGTGSPGERSSAAWTVILVLGAVALRARRWWARA